MNAFKGRKFTVGDLLDEEEPTVNLGDASNRQRSGPFVATPTDVYPPNQSPATGHSRAAAWRTWQHKPTLNRVGLVGAGFILGICCSGAFFPSAPNPTSEPATVTTVPVQAPAVTVTVTEPNPGVTLPSTCLDAIYQAGKILSDASAISSVGNRARDLISQAYQASVLGDTAKLNQATRGLMDLDKDLASHNEVVLPPWQDIMNGLATCQEN